MTRKKIVAGNWKMNKTAAEAKALVAGIRQATADGGGPVEVVVCPPFTALESAAAALAGSRIALGAQNMNARESGAFTGEISAAMLAALGVRYVILGHSERRNILGESSEEVNKKVEAALAADLTPIVCVGELLSERKAGRTHDVVRRQFDGSLSGLTAEQMTRAVIAYEPVWAIGTGEVATPQQAEEVHLGLRQLLESRYNKQVAEAVRIQYGGSVKPDNAAELLAQPNIDGALVGGASLEAEPFLGIIAGAKN